MWRRNHRTKNLVGMEISQKSLFEDEGTATSKTSMCSSLVRKTAERPSSVVSHSSPFDVATVVQSLMIKQIDLSRIIANRLRVKGEAYTQHAVGVTDDTMDLATEQEYISKSFVDTIHTMIARIVDQETEIQNTKESHRKLERHLERTTETLDFKTSEVANLKDRLDAQQDEISMLHKRLQETRSMCSYLESARRIEVPCPSKGKQGYRDSQPDVEALKETVARKSDELTRAKSKLKDTQFLLLAYKDRVTQLDRNGRSTHREKNDRPSFMPLRLDETVPLPELEQNSDASSVDISLFL